MADRNLSSGSSAKRKRVTRPRPSPKTRTIVGVMSHDECAFPDCLEAIVKEKENGERYLAGDLCHIYGKEEGSARYDSSLTAEEVNAEENLLFLCRNHHREVDADPERYTVLKLKEWRAAHERRMGPLAREQMTERLTLAVEREIGHIRQARFFQGFDSTAYALGFRNRLQAEYAVAKAAVRVRAFAWCARVLADDRLDAAEECLRHAEGLLTGKESSVEIAIARAFVRAARSDVSHALKNLDTEASPMALAAALTLLNRDKDAEAALSWFDGTEATLAALDSDGRLIFLLTLQIAGRWERVEAARLEIRVSDYEETPALHYVVGVALVAGQTPEDLRPQVLAAVPLNAVNFPLSSTPEAMRKLREARTHFEKAQAAVRSFGIAETAATAGDYALWLRLRDPSAHEDATKDLTRALSVLPDNLRLVPMAVQCSVPFDTGRVESVIVPQLTGKSPFASDAAFARLALAFTKEPQDAADYLGRHADELTPFIEPKQINTQRVELLMLASKYEEARQVVEDLASTDLPSSELARLRSILRYSKSSDVAVLKSQYERTGATADLGRLVMEMQRHSDWDGVCDYGRRLFNRTRSLEDAERLASALIHSESTEDLGRLLQCEEVSAMTSNSDTLKKIRCWHLFEMGRVRECEVLFRELPADRSDPNWDSLRFNLAVVTGDWMRIPAMVAEGHNDLEKQSVQDLVEMADRSIRFDLPYTKDLVHEIADRGRDDPHAMAAAYWLAISAEMEDDPTVGQWLRQAMVMSDEHGPMREVPLSNVVTEVEAWRSRTTEVSEMLRRGEIPACAVSQNLGIPLLDLTLRCAMQNAGTRSGGRRGVVAAYSGVRGAATIRSTKCVGLGPSAVLTLSFLGILKEAIEEMGAVLIPHGTLAWLYVETAAIRFPQPGRLAAAKVAAQLSAEGVLQPARDESRATRSLGDAIGRDLSALLTAVRSAGGKVPHVVVAENPVRTLAGGEMRPVDLSEHYGYLVSPRSVLRALVDRLVLTQEEERHLGRDLHETGEWPDEPRLTPQSVLYFDAPTVARFLMPRVGIDTLLRRVADAGYGVRVSEETMRDHRSLLLQEDLRRGMSQHVEEIRGVLKEGIASGKVHLAARPRPKTEDEAATSRYPELDLVRLAGERGAGLSGVMIDDRYLNQYRSIGPETDGVPVWTTWDWLRRRRLLGKHGVRDFAEKANTLRRAGYLFVPLTSEDLTGAVMAAEIEDGQLKLTSDLAALRGQVELVRESRCLQIPGEAPWLREFMGGCADAIREVWSESATDEEAVARAEWIGDLLGGAGWTIFPREAESRWVAAVMTEYAESLRRPLLTSQDSRSDRYRQWVERCLSESPGSRSAQGAKDTGGEAVQGRRFSGWVRRGWKAAVLRWKSAAG